MIMLQEIEYYGDYSIKIAEPMIAEKRNLYAGCVMKSSKDRKNDIPCRKIIFSLNEDGTVNDLLYDTPNYKINSNDTFYISNAVNLEKLLEFYNYREFLTESDIRRIYKYFLSPNGKFFSEDPRKLPLTLTEYIDLDMISQLRKKTTRDEKKEVEKFKKKVKTYTLR